VAGAHGAGIGVAPPVDNVMSTEVGSIPASGAMNAVSAGPVVIGVQSGIAVVIFTSAGAMLLSSMNPLNVAMTGAITSIPVSGAVGSPTGSVASSASGAIFHLYLPPPPTESGLIGLPFLPLTTSLIVSSHSEPVATVVRSVARTNSDGP